MRKRVIVHGRVQGVGFRVAVQRAAEMRRLRGWVRNRSDGTVEALLDGEAEAVEAVIRFCRTGPRLAQVDRVDVTELDACGEESLFGFAVR